MMMMMMMMSEKKTFYGNRPQVFTDLYHQIQAQIKEEQWRIQEFLNGGARPRRGRIFRSGVCFDAPPHIPYVFVARVVNKIHNVNMCVTHVRVYISIHVYINKFGGDYPIFPICACAIYMYHFLTQLPNALARCYLQCTPRQRNVTYNALVRCHFALARCYLQCTTRQRVVTNTPLCFCKWPYPDTILKRSPLNSFVLLLNILITIPRLF